MTEPGLLTQADAHELVQKSTGPVCCHVQGCTDPAEFWAGPAEYDSGVLVCRDHAMALRRDVDDVMLFPLSEWRDDED